MSWFWGSGDKKDSSNDPLQKLDPSLRDFLDKESPAQRDDNNISKKATRSTSTSAQLPSSANTPSTNYRAQLGLNVPGLDIEHQNPERPERTQVPAESLFQDGRYAHLWKSYRPQSEVEAGSRSDQDRLAGIAEAYRERKAAVGRAALENCVVEQMTERECWRNGGWKQTMTMCRAEGRAFTRCYEMQARFLRALGYLSSAPRGPEDDERIQMHADKLYHEMLAREQAEQEARAEGREPPRFEPLIRHESVEQALGKESAWSRARQRATEHNVPTAVSQMPPERQKEIAERIKGKSELEREVELQLMAAEQRAQLEYADEVSAQLADERRLRAERREQGRETFGDAMKRLWGWDK